MKLNLLLLLLLIIVPVAMYYAVHYNKGMEEELVVIH
jgi:hypothetical protein